MGPSMVLDVLWFFRCYLMFCGSLNGIRCSVGPSMVLDILWVLQWY